MSVKIPTSEELKEAAQLFARKHETVIESLVIAV
jgi:hypothetical protein